MLQVCLWAIGRHPRSGARASDQDRDRGQASVVGLGLHIGRRERECRNRALRWGGISRRGGPLRLMSEEGVVGRAESLVPVSHGDHNAGRGESSGGRWRKRG